MKTVVAIHGAGMQAGVWEYLAGRLPSCRALSLPGHGATPGPLLRSIPAMAAWVETQLKDAPANSVVLMGHSMGALVALEAANNPAVAALVLIGAAAQMPVNPDLLKKATEAPDDASALVLKWSISPEHPEAEEAVREYMQPSALANDLAACNDYHSGAATARTIDKLALVLTGVGDKMTKSSASAALTARLPMGRFTPIADCGHMPMVEDPNTMAREISIFVAEAEA